jgi:hypothetical protein
LIREWDDLRRKMEVAVSGADEASILALQPKLVAKLRKVTELYAYHVSTPKLKCLVAQVEGNPYQVYVKALREDALELMKHT